MSHELTLPRGGAISTPGTPGVFVMPYMFTTTPPGSDNVLLCPRGIGISPAPNPTVSDLLDNLVNYYPFNSATNPLEDIEGSLDLAGSTLEDATGWVAGGITCQGITGYANAGTGYTVYEADRSVVSAWVKIGLAGGEVTIAGKDTNSISTYAWYKLMSYVVPADNDFHLVVIGIERPFVWVSVDGAGATSATMGYAGVEGGNDWDTPYLLIQGGAVVDEMAIFYHPEAVTASIVEDYADALWNSGTGLYYRVPEGWLEPTTVEPPVQILLYPPTMYWAMDSAGATLVDERGVLDLDSVSNTKAGTGKYLGGIGHDGVGVSSVVRRAVNATRRDSNWSTWSAWVNLGTDGDVMLGCKASGSEDWQWYKQLSSFVPVDGDWHHVFLLLNSWGTPLFYYWLDGESDLAPHPGYVEQWWNCPEFITSGDALLDEVAVHVYDDAYDIPYVRNVARFINCGGTGRFWREGQGWLNG